MRNTEERVLAVKQRAKELERHRRIRKVRISYVAASLLFIIGLSFAMPGIMTVMPDNEYNFSGAAAGIFGQKGGIAYVLIGLLAFLLGVGVTILSYRLSLKNRLEGMDSEDGDG
ncbi:MAG: DUF4179 domain-containing protein [Firmicutes bacterium]|nr:DUF4179 domain-containing protein [Bacillota bacterium]